MTEDRQFGFGIVGLGNIAAHHVQAIRSTPGCRLVAAASRSDANRHRHGLGRDVVCVADYRQMLVVPGLDVVCVCTPSGQHLGPAVAAARAGKHVVVEKPLEITVERCRRLIKECHDARVSLACIFQNRYSTAFARVRELLAAGSLGRLVLGNAYVKWHRDQAYYDAADWRGTLRGDGGAALINQSIHTIDLLVAAMGPVRSVRGKIATLTHDIEGEDVGCAVLEMESGALATIEGTTSLYEGFPERLEIHGDAGSVILEAGEIVTLRTRDGLALPDGGGEARASGSSDPMAIDVELHRRQYAEIVRALGSGRSPEVDGASGLRSLQVVQAIYESSRSGREVVLDRV